MSSTEEHDIAVAVMKIAAANPSGIATFNQMRADIPSYTRLTSAQKATSSIRSPEPMWHQLFRNIKSHDQAEGNAIYEGWLIHIPSKGYQVTAKGRKYIAKLP